MSFQDLRANRAARHTSHARLASPSDAAVGIDGLQLNEGDTDPWDELYQDHLNDIQWDFSGPGIPTSSDAGPSKSAPPPSAPPEESVLDEATTHGLGLGAYGLEVRRTRGKGRGLFTGKKGYKAGDRILRVPEKAVASVLSPGRLSTRCSNCYLNMREVRLLANEMDVESDISKKGLLRCTGCKTIHYCSKGCQREDWPYHAPECKSFSILQERDHAGHEPMLGESWIPLDYFRALGRLVWARKKWRDSHPGEGEYVLWNQYKLMQRHVDDSPRKHEEFSHVAKQLQTYLSTSPAHDPKATHEELVELTSRLQTNTFTLTAPDLTPLGCLISPPAAMSNHSCYPNAVVVFPFGAGKVEMIAIGEIRPGEEILTTYVDTSKPRSVRQADLASTYGFDCTCSLCNATSPVLDPAPVDPRWCLAHAGCSKKGRIPMPKAVYPQSLKALISALDQGLGWEGKVKGICDGCDQEVAMDIKELPGLVQQGMEYIEMDDRGQLVPSLGSREKAISKIKALLSSLATCMPPHSYPSVPLYGVLFRLHLPVTPSTIESAIFTISLACDVAPAIYPPHYPALAVLLAEKASIINAYPNEESNQPGPHVLEQQLRNTHAAATMALRACEKGFGSSGSGGLLGLRMRQIVETTEMVLSRFAEFRRRGHA